MIEPLPATNPVSCLPCDCSVVMTPDQAVDLAAVFKVLSDPIRLRIASIVACCPAGELCMGDIAAEFDVSGPTVSHHLRKLREAGVLASERRANEVYYRAVPERLGAALDCLAVTGLVKQGG
ncbi:hypothetical protein GCM10020229_52030 [Kitasatospora albolonga]|uniref:ArsR/SmtB family transcription factor n=1 Tax=Kitasatospora albolonga TaxID=68173 RepID=UPI0031EC53B4